MIDLTRNEAQIRKNAAHCRERNIRLPTFREMKNPENISGAIRDEMKSIGLWDMHPRNLYVSAGRMNPFPRGELWCCERDGDSQGNHRGEGQYHRIGGEVVPTGAHKVGATYGCIAPALVTGQFDPSSTKAVWPSTGNYCRGGAYISSLLGCESVAILPEGMSRERFEWLQKVAGEIIATPGTESNVKEIFDQCWELKKPSDIRIFNQFEEFGNTLWHYHVTGNAAKEAFEKASGGRGRLAGSVSSSGSAGTLGFGYFLKDQYPTSKLVAAEALQCPTLLYNGYGEHRIEGIGDKHIPWIHDCKNTDMVVSVDDETVVKVVRLLMNPKAGNT